jgi:hypothetical protein
LFDDAHGFSQRANAFVDRRGGRIATCLLVENGVIRVLGSPNCSRRGALSIQQVRDRLRSACAALDHMFWPDDVSLRDKAWFNFGRLQGHNQVADRVLLGLAVRHRGCLATFDQAIGRQSVHGAATRHLLL